MSLPHPLAASRAAKNLVLLGDSAQLEQPQHGAHPDGVAVSAGEHLVGEAGTSRARGVCVLVASPRLFEVESRTPEQLRWASGLCGFVAAAMRIDS